MLQVEDFYKGKYAIKISNTEYFQDCVEILKQNYATFDPKLKLWLMPTHQLDSLRFDASSIDEEVEMSALAKDSYQKYEESLRELDFATSRRVLDWNLLWFRPLKGKHPYEDYQLIDLRKALHQNRFLFFWEMGLGKSYVTAALLTFLKKYDNVNKALIFSTRIGLYNLQAELLKFSKTIDPKRMKVLSSRTLSKNKFVFDNDDYDYYILSYDMFKTISDAYYCREKNVRTVNTEYRKSYMPIKEWFGNSNTAVFLDECHMLSHHKSRRSQIMLQNIDEFKYRYLFTGTLADKYEKLYMPSRLLDKSLVDGYGFGDWLSKYATLGTRFSKFAVANWNINKINELNKLLLEKYGSKRLMKECLDLPPDYEKTLSIDMSPEQRFIYEAFSNQGMAFIKERSEAGAFQRNALNMFQFFQIAVDNPSRLKESEAYERFTPELKKAVDSFKYKKDFAKLELIDNIISEHVDEKDQKGILWYIHPMTAQSLGDYYAKYNPTLITSDLKEDQRFAIIEKFLKDQSSKLLIASIYLLNTSVTLTECKWQVYVENTYDYTMYSQSRGRIFRPGQDEETFTYFVLYNDSIDNVQRKNLESKGELLTSLMNKKFIEQYEWRELFNMKVGGTE